MTRGSVEKVLSAGIDELPGCNLGVGQRENLLAYLDLLERWNKTYNLTAVRDPLNMVSRHILDSLSVLPWAGQGQLLDAGTGPGLPGIPLAIANPGLQVTLLDSAGKKVRFLNHVKRTLGLPNIETVNCRLESLQSKQEFDAVISRAFSSLAAFAGATRESGIATGRLLAMKGRFPVAEFEALPEWVRVDSVERLSVPGLQEDRHLVIMSLIE